MGEKVASDLRLGSGFCQALRLPPPVTSGLSQLSHNMAKKFMKNKIQNSLSHSWDGVEG